MNLESPHLLLTPLQKEDEAQFIALHCDEQVRSYLGGAIDRKTAAARFRKQLESVDNTNDTWAVRLKSDGSFIGILDLGPHHDCAEVEISYLFLPESWGHGYATEAVRRLLTHGLYALGLPRVVAETQTANCRSCRLLERCGMIRERTLTRFGVEQAIYVTEKEAV